MLFYCVLKNTTKSQLIITQITLFAVLVERNMYMKSIFNVFTVLTKSQLKKSVIILFLMVIGALCETFGIALIMPLISLMGDVDYLSNYPRASELFLCLGIDEHTQLVVVLTVILLVFFFVKNFFLGFIYKVQIRFSTNLHIYYINKMLEYYLVKPYEYFLKINPSVIQRNILVCSQNVFIYTLISIFQLLTETITSIMIVVMLIIIDPLVSITLSVIMIGVLYLLAKSFRKNISIAGTNLNNSTEILHKWVNQSIGAIKETKVLRRENFFLSNFKKANLIWSSSISSYQFISQLPRLIIESISVLGILGLILFKIAIGENVSTIVSLMAVLALSAFRLMPSANRILSTYNTIKFQLPNLDAIYDDLVKIKEHGEYKQKSQIINDTYQRFHFRHKITVRALKYSYPSTESDSHKNKIILNGVDFEIPKGKFVGIIGQSGTGKTTFIDILLGLLSPVSGHIYVDEKDIQSNIRGWQANISYVPQTIYLIDGTIKENIALGYNSEDIDDNRIKLVLEQSDLLDFISTLPNGINTSVGDRGVRLSGGQKQRIGIARALYTNPEVLILDEATSALDNNTELRIMKSILKLKGKITIIAIAHRLSSLAECDFMIKFDNGNSVIVQKN